MQAAVLRMMVFTPAVAGIGCSPQGLSCLSRVGLVREAAIYTTASVKHSRHQQEGHTRALNCSGPHPLGKRRGVPCDDGCGITPTRKGVPCNNAKWELADAQHPSLLPSEAAQRV